MFRFEELKQLHLEISNNCQASCPMCDRNVRGGLPNELLKVRDWTFEDYKTIVSPEVIKQIDNLYMCGNYGDPGMNNDLPKMLAYTRQLSDIPISIHTNGGMRKSEWWANLAQYLNSGESKIVFAIDGLEDTHHLYRIGTTYDKVIENAKAFIDAGGNAQWVFIRFKHNEHQVEEARRRATELGFQEFVVKDSIRFHGSNDYDVWDKNGNVTHTLQPSSTSEMKFIPKEMLSYDNAKKFVDSVDIKCKVKEMKEVYIDAFGHLYPCCFVGHAPTSTLDPVSPVSNLKPIVAEQVENAVKLMGGTDAINTRKRSIKEIVNSNEYQTVWSDLWDQRKLWICSKTCGVTKKISTWEDQFQQYDFIASDKSF